VCEVRAAVRRGSTVSDRVGTGSTATMGRESRGGLVHAGAEAMTGLVLFARSRCSPRACLGVALGLLVVAALQGHSFVTPVVPWDVVVVTTPLLPAVVAVLALRLCPSTTAGLEDVLAPRRAALLRLQWAVVLTVALAAGCAVMMWIAQAVLVGDADTASSPLAAARNTAAFFALGLLTSVVLGGDLGWTTPVLLVTALVFFGRTPDQVVRGWALLLRPAGDLVSLFVVVVLIALACVAYRQHDARGVPDPKG
jgi:hypothetical protein